MNYEVTQSILHLSRFTKLLNAVNRFFEAKDVMEYERFEIRCEQEISVHVLEKSEKPLSYQSRAAFWMVKCAVHAWKI